MKNRFALPLVTFIAFVLFAGCASVQSPDAHWAQWDEQPVREFGGTVLTSQYLTMRDGVKIAIDIYLPANLGPGEKLPTILDQTRYWRSVGIRWPISVFIPEQPKEIMQILQAGYAFVRVDARGSGASFGSRNGPWSPDETKDGAEIVDWIIAQPWSDGVVGAAGISYEGTAAEFLAVNKHPAVKAIAPMFSLYDVYPEIAFPGGVLLEWFTSTWQKGNMAMDLNDPGIFHWWLPLATSGVRPVDGDEDRALLDEAVAGHERNYHVHEEALQLTYRDDVSSGGLSMDRFSPYRFVDDLRAANVPYYSYSGWFDGGYANAAIKRFLNVRTPGSRLVIGPWDHGGDTHVQPFDGPLPTAFDHMGEAVRFFDHYLKGIDNGIDAEPPVHYYTMVENRWKSAQSWPPQAETVSFYTAENHLLSTSKPTATEAFDSYLVDLAAGTGPDARWNSLGIETDTNYPDRAEQDAKLLVYQTTALTENTEVTGHPIVTLYVDSTATDGEFFVYLEDVDEQGRVAYVTEGVLRAIHRELSDRVAPYFFPVPFYRTFTRADAMPLVPGETAELKFDLNPTSYLFRQGHRVRIAVAGADADHFLVLPGPAPTIKVHRSAVYATRIELPVVR